MQFADHLDLYRPQSSEGARVPSADDLAVRCGVDISD